MTIVAPFMGAWIETDLKELYANKGFVAPFMGAWIETLFGSGPFEHDLSRPSWARGLKLVKKRGKEEQKVAPFMGAWIETNAV